MSIGVKDEGSTDDATDALINIRVKYPTSFLTNSDQTMVPYIAS